MLNNQIRICLFVLLSSLLLSACSQLGLQPKKETKEPTLLPECKKNYIKEGNFISGRVYKTWVKYENLDLKKGFDVAVTTIKSRGNRVIFADRASGIINAEMAFEVQERGFHPVEIELVKQKTSLIVYLSSKAAGGASGSAKLCSFYSEFEKNIKRTVTAPKPRQTTAPPKQLPEPEKESTPPASPPTPAVTSTFPSPSPPSPHPEVAILQAEVIWTYVNLREGPGINYKKVGKAQKGTLLEILEEKRGWIYVRLEDGMEAWMSKRATSEAHYKPSSSRQPPPTAPSPSSSPSASTSQPPPSSASAPQTSDSPKPLSPM